MPPVFDWDEENRKHIVKHRVTPAEAEQVVLNDPIDLTLQVSDGEERIVQVGATNKGRILIVVTTWREGMIRVITAYPAPRQLREFYLQNTS
jgi:uncharacterized DUF497 family protein